MRVDVDDDGRARIVVPRVDDGTCREPNAPDGAVGFDGRHRRRLIALGRIDLEVGQDLIVAARDVLPEGGASLGQLLEQDGHGDAFDGAVAGLG